MQMTDKNWIGLLSEDHPPAEETVITILGKLPRTLRVRKEDWRNHFSEFGGIGFKRGEEIEIVPMGDGGPKAEVPDWARERLVSGSSDAICIMRRDRRYFLKKLELVEQPSDVPACIAVDRFDGDRVERAYWNRTMLDEFTYDAIDRLLPAIPRLRYDPVVPFENMEGRLGFLGRKEFFGGFTKADRSLIQDYKKEICQDQGSDGSWEQSAARTAFKLIRLLEVGATMDESAAEKAATWLLEAKEPLGFPGLFMFSEKTADSFNAWKEKQGRGSKKRGSRSSTAAQRRFFMENSDILGASNAYCELKLTWTTGIVLEALLRCGLHDEERVVKAINTLLAMSGGGGWCGCGYFVANIYHDESTETPDFNSRPIQVKGRNPGSVGLGPGDILNITDNHLYRGHTLGQNETLMVRKGVEGSGDCPMVVSKGLSYHPAYHGSNLETMLALQCSHRQGWLGDWTDNYTSFFFSLLSRSRCPLSAYLVLRTFPLLARQQGEDGFWQEEPILPDSKKPIPVPTKEESTFMILTALKTFGFLDVLRPV